MNGAGDAPSGGRKLLEMLGVSRRQEEESSSADLRPEFRQEWHQVQDQLQRFESSFDTGTQFLEPASEITSNHWVKNSDCNQCSNKGCKRQLWPISKHHCRKCGKIFCAKCVEFKRRLSPNAEYDPNGWLYKVCEECFGSKVQEMGHSRRWTYDIYLFRKARQSRENAKPSRTSALRHTKHLVAGFQMHHQVGGAIPQTEMPMTNRTGLGVIMNSFSRLKTGVSKVINQGVPDWQKPPTWVTDGEACQCCNRPYGKLNSQHNCLICGKLVCKGQSSKDLLLYTPDKSDVAELGSEPRWAVLRVIGCPEIEPDHHLYLRVCFPCRDQLKDLQVEGHRHLLSEGSLVNQCWRVMIDIYGDIIAVQAKIDVAFPEFQKLVDGLEIQTGAPSSLPPARSNMQTLAKHQGDLSDHLASFVVTTARLKKLQPQTRGQVKLIKQLIRCKLAYYTETNSMFRQLRKQLGQFMPEAALDQIQGLVDTTAINSACLSLNQLAYESLHLCTKYKLQESLPLTLKLKQTAEVCEADLKNKVEKQGENWKDHKQQIEVFVKIQMKGDPEQNVKPHTYIRPSRRKIKTTGAAYVESFLKQRVQQMLSKIWVQLVNRTADRSFRLTKESLEELKESLTEINRGYEVVGAQDCM